MNFNINSCSQVSFNYKLYVCVLMTPSINLSLHQYCKAYCSLHSRRLLSNLGRAVLGNAGGAGGARSSCERKGSVFPNNTEYLILFKCLLCRLGLLVIAIGIPRWLLYTNSIFIEPVKCFKYIVTLHKISCNIMLSR